MQTPEIIRAAALTLAALAGICCMYQSVYLVVSIIVRLREGRGGLPAVVPKQLPRFGILIAARNEQAVLPYLLQSIREQDYPRELVRVFVVADNCTDDTALAAERAGATVWRRFDRERIGKGYALAYLLEHMEKSGQTEGIDAFLVFDADNLLCPDYLRQISRMYTQGFAAFHGYRNTKNFGDSWISSGYGVWFLHDSIHLNTARMALGTTCAVSGTGFGFTKELLEQCGGWRFFTLTEDVEFDTWCATHGVRIGFCREAMLYDEQPVTLRQSWTQRIRWVQGGIQVSLRYAGELARGLLRGGRTSWASFETAMLSLWGYLMGMLGTGGTILAAGITWGAGTAWMTALRLLLGMIGWMALLGALTVVSEWRRICAPAHKKLLAVVTFPFFMLTFVPVAVAALFCRRGWAPVAHTVAVPIGMMQAEK